MQVEDSNNEEDAIRIKTKRPRITLESYDYYGDERKIEVIHDDGQEIYEPYVLMMNNLLPACLISG